MLTGTSNDTVFLQYMVSTIFLPQASSSAHQDPIKEFVECLYVNYDFDLAQQKLLECEKVRGEEPGCLALFPGTEEGGRERAPGLHCLHMHQIIAKATYRHHVVPPMQLPIP